MPDRMAQLTIERQSLAWVANVPIFPPVRSVKGVQWMNSVRTAFNALKTNAEVQELLAQLKNNARIHVS